MTGAGPLRLGQDFTCSAVRAGVALLLSHRDHEPSCEASDDGSETSLAAGDLLPTLLPSRWTRRVPRGQLWNVRPVHGLQRTVLDDVPTPTDLRVAVGVAVQRRAASYTEDRSSALVQHERI